MGDRKYKQLLNYNESGHVVTNEPVLIPAAANQETLFKLQHDNFQITSVSVKEGAVYIDLGLAPVVAQSDPNTTFEDYYNAVTFKIGDSLEVGGVTYTIHSGMTLYVNYTTIGDYVDADDINEKLTRLDSLATGATSKTLVEYDPTYDELTSSNKSLADVETEITTAITSHTGTFDHSKIDVAYNNRINPITPIAPAESIPAGKVLITASTENAKNITYSSIDASSISQTGHMHLISSLTDWPIPAVTSSDTKRHLIVEPDSSAYSLENFEGINTATNGINTPISSQWAYNHENKTETVSYSGIDYTPKIHVPKYGGTADPTQVFLNASGEYGVPAASVESFDNYANSGTSFSINVAAGIVGTTAKFRGINVSNKLTATPVVSSSSITIGYTLDVNESALSLTSTVNGKINSWGSVSTKGIQFSDTLNNSTDDATNYKLLSFYDDSSKYYLSHKYTESSSTYSALSLYGMYRSTSTSLFKVMMSETDLKPIVYERGNALLGINGDIVKYGLPFVDTNGTTILRLSLSNPYYDDSMGTDDKKIPYLEKSSSPGYKWAAADENTVLQSSGATKVVSFGKITQDYLATTFKLPLSYLENGELNSGDRDTKNYILTYLGVTSSTVPAITKSIITDHALSFLSTYSGSTGSTDLPLAGGTMTGAIIMGGTSANILMGSNVIAASTSDSNAATLILKSHTPTTVSASTSSIELVVNGDKKLTFKKDTTNTILHVPDRLHVTDTLATTSISATAYVAGTVGVNSYKPICPLDVRNSAYKETDLTSAASTANGLFVYTAYESAALKGNLGIRVSTSTANQGAKITLENTKGTQAVISGGAFSSTTSGFLSLSVRKDTTTENTVVQITPDLCRVAGQLRVTDNTSSSTLGQVDITTATKHGLYVSATGASNYAIYCNSTGSTVKADLYLTKGIAIKDITTANAGKVLTCDSDGIFTPQDPQMPTYITTSDNMTTLDLKAYRTFVTTYTNSAKTIGVTNISDAPNGAEYTLIIYYSGTHSNAITFNSTYFKFPYNIPPVLTKVNGGFDVIRFIHTKIGSTSYLLAAGTTSFNVGA